MRALLSLLLTLSVVTLARAEPPRMSYADVNEVISSIKDDEEKLRNYCTIFRLLDELGRADDENDHDRLGALDQQLDVATRAMGPDFDRLLGSKIDEVSAGALLELGAAC